MPNTTTNTAATVARNLYYALVAEAREWAADIDSGLLDRADDLPPAQVLHTIASNVMVPDELLGAVVAALTELDPHTYTDPATGPTMRVEELAGSVERARARAEAFVWGFQHAHGPADIGTTLAAEFAADYAEGMREFLAGARGILPPLPAAFSAWRAGNDIADALPLLPRAALPDQVPDQEAFGEAMADPIAELMWAAASGYGHGWCDGAGLGSGSVGEFGAAVAVWFADHGCDPDLLRAWRAWRTGRPLATALAPRQLPPSNPNT